MSRPKPTPEDAAAAEARIARYGLRDSDFTEAQLEELRRELSARFLQEDKREREYRRRQKAGLPRRPGDTGERRT